MVKYPNQINNYNSIDRLLFYHSQKYQDKEAIITFNPDESDADVISYKQLYEFSYHTAHHLNEAGIGLGDRFSILMHNSPEVLLLELGGALIGATTVPLDYKRDTLERKIYKLKETDSKALFIKFDQNADKDEIYEIQKSLPGLKVVSWNYYAEFLNKIFKIKKKDKLNIVDDFNHTYIILYTSGTTAHPKGAILSQRACLLNADGIAKWQEFEDSDRFNIVLPLHHINSTIFCLSMVLVGGTIILNKRYSASKFWDVVSELKATNSSIVPTILHDLLVRFDEFKSEKLDTSSLKRICIGSAPVFPEETLEFYKKFRTRVVQGYGQTETALRVAGVPVGVDEKIYIEMVKNNTIGFPLANNELAIMDENNNWIKENEEGEICIKGPILADGYLNDEQATKHAFKKGWFHSGDLGKYKIINGKKYYFIVGRIREIIIKGGVNLSPSAIEDAILKNFKEVDEVSVVGYPDDRWGEEIAIVIVVKKEFIKDALKIKDKILMYAQKNEISGISPYEMPKKVFVVDQLPKTSTGKMQRVLVKKMIGELLSEEKIKKYYVRRIYPNETEVLTQSVGINNSRFIGLPATIGEFRQRARNGFLFGAFEEKGELVGSISGLRMNMDKLKKVKIWREASGDGTLINHDPSGGTLLCVAISVKSKKDYPRNWNKISENKLKKFAKKNIKDYVDSNKDYIINFHKIPKGGLSGAEVWRILESGRLDDKDAVGYNVLMRYPKINKKVMRSHNTSPAIMLIEEVLYYAWQNGIKNVIAFSRPAGFREYLLTKLKFHK